MSTHPRERAQRIPNAASEARLMEIRREAETRGRVEAAGARPIGAPFPKASAETGYYGIHLLKEPQWKPTIPLYFFVGGAAGSSAVIAAFADWFGRDPELAQTARWVAFSGALASTALLIEDLGRPSRFLNMLRVFKPQSPMSMGAWTLAAFGGVASATVFANAVEQRFGTSRPIRIVGDVGQFLTALFGLPFHNYTGVLIGATAIPVWNRTVTTLPIHFGMSGVQAGVSILELFGHNNSRALNSLGIGSAVYEMLEGFNLESRNEPALKPLKSGVSGWITRAGGVMSGPLPLLLRIFAGSSGTGRSRTLRKWAAVSGILGSLLTRYGWVHAGRSSAQDWRIPLEIPQDSAVVKELQSRPTKPQVKAAG
jgi:Polysulphide reductase, NrfD